MINFKSRIQEEAHKIGNTPTLYHAIVLDEDREPSSTVSWYKIYRSYAETEGSLAKESFWPEPVIAFVKAKKEGLIWKLYDNTFNWTIESQFGYTLTTNRAQLLVYQRAHKIAQIASRCLGVPLVEIILSEQTDRMIIPPKDRLYL